MPKSETTENARTRESLAVWRVLRESGPKPEIAYEVLDLPAFSDGSAAAKWIRTEAPAGVYVAAKLWPAVKIVVETKPVRSVS